MALSIPRLSLALQSAAVAGGAVSGPPLIAMCNAQAAAIINEFTNNAEVLPTGTPPMSNSGGAVAGKGVIT